MSASRCRFAALGLVWIQALTLWAQQSSPATRTSDVEEIFRRGVNSYNQGRYRQAEQSFAELTRGAKWNDAGKVHQRLTAALYMNASSAFHLGRFAEAQDHLQRLLDDFPKSKYVEHGRALRGAIYFKQERFEEAARELLWVVDNGTRPELVSRQAQLARSLLADYLTIEQLQSLQKSAPGDLAQALLALQIVRHQVGAGDRDEATKTIEIFRKAYPRSKILDDLNALLDTAGARPGAAAHIGVILPLSGEFSKEGNGILSGIRYAFETYRRDKASLAPLELIVKDSESNMLRALKEAQTLLRDPSIIALIGELETDISGGLGALAQAAQTPLLIPTPTVNDLTALGENVFQTTADLESKGRALARYAIEKRLMKNFATIAPNNEYGRQMTDGFTAEVDRLGGQILAQKWYFETPEDLARHFKSIREIAFRRMLLDSLVAAGKSPSAINLNAEWRAFDERFKEERQKQRRFDKQGIVEATDVPVTNLDAIFLPVYGDEVGTIARQVSYFNIRAQILGGEHWYLSDLDKSRELQRYVDGAIFTSDYYINPFDGQYRTLQTDFRQRMNRTPERWEIMGIDAARLLLAVYATGARSRSQMRQALASTQQFNAIRGKIDFAPNRRMNQYINLVQIRQNKFEKLP
jgi:ABC-type branched-subunit amino acid transport system substrate-binding protein